MFRLATPLTRRAAQTPLAMPNMLMVPPTRMLQLPIMALPMRMYAASASNPLQVSQRRKQFLMDIYEESKANAEPGSKEFDLDKFQNMWIDQHPNPESVGQFYDSVADHLAYDGFNVWIGFIDPYLISQVIYKPKPRSEHNRDEFNFGYLNARRDAKIFDLGQGTGLLGRLLTEQGFSHIDSADASEKSCKVASDSGWYKSNRCMYFGNGVDQLPANWIGSYDIVMASGVFSKGHIPAEGFDDVFAMLKRGGHFVTSFRKSYLDDEDELGFKAKLEQLEDEGKIEFVKTWTFMRGNNENPYDFFQEMPFLLVVIKKLA